MEHAATYCSIIFKRAGECDPVSPIPPKPDGWPASWRMVGAVLPEAGGIIWYWERFVGCRDETAPPGARCRFCGRMGPPLPDHTPATRAIGIVAALEGKPVSPSEVDAMALYPSGLAALASLERKAGARGL